MKQHNGQEKPAGKERIFFPNLDGLRFVCFFMVFLHHCYKTMFSSLKGTMAYSFLEAISLNGTLGVNFFFVLSGFLITYLLIKEKEKKGTVHLGNFYVRRILRIWPLYYVCVMIGFLIFPYLKQLMGGVAEENASPWPYLIFLSNFDFMHTWPAVPDALVLAVLWSVSVEEQFYLSWPVILKYIQTKYFPYVFGIIIAATLIFRSFYTGHNDTDYGVRYFHTLSVIGDMALGALFAYLCSFESGFIRYIRNMKKIEIVFIYIIAIALFLFKKQIFYPAPLVVIERIVIAFFLGLIIVEQNYAKNSFYKFSQFRIMTKLGVYTYGLYCLHFIGIMAAELIAAKLNFNMHNLFVNLSVAVIALLVAIGVSIASYYLFEHHFLKLKDRFAFITKN
jgi:peptidoglycan/LPS O-acetylase OafA/YrhL